MLKKYKSKISALRGFTLLELIIVIAIIGILAVLVLPNFATALAKARDSSRVSELSGLKTNLLLYSQENDGYFPRPGYDETTPAACAGFGCILANKIDSRLPLRVNKDAGQQTNDKYNYAGLGCSAKGCIAYQIWTQLETKNAALNNDSDLTGNAAAVTLGIINAAGTGDGTVMAGQTETCTARNPTGFDCIFDLLP